VYWNPDCEPILLACLLTNFFLLLILLNMHSKISIRFMQNLNFGVHYELFRYYSTKALNNDLLYRTGLMNFVITICEWPFKSVDFPCLVLWMGRAGEGGAFGSRHIEIVERLEFLLSSSTCASMGCFNHDRQRHFSIFSGRLQKYTNSSPL
jgi:hypothetical protein